MTKTLYASEINRIKAEVEQIIRNLDATPEQKSNIFKATISNYNQNIVSGTAENMVRETIARWNSINRPVSARN